MDKQLSAALWALSEYTSRSDSFDESYVGRAVSDVVHRILDIDCEYRDDKAYASIERDGEPVAWYEADYQYEAIIGCAAHFAEWLEANPSRN